MPVVKVARLAGQSTVPCISAEDCDEESTDMDCYRGDIINQRGSTKTEREPNPLLMLKAFAQSSATLNLLRSLAAGGFQALKHATTHWDMNLTPSTVITYERYWRLSNRVDEALRFMETMGKPATDQILKATTMWSSHECMLLPYEEACLRKDFQTGEWFDCSAHMLWLGDHTRQLDGCHVEFLRGVANPLGIKVSDKMSPEELVKLFTTLNPDNKPGRVTIIVRMKAEVLHRRLPLLIQALRQAKCIVTWTCDPMQRVGKKILTFQEIQEAVTTFLDVHEAEGSHAGGLHLTMTGQNYLAECPGGKSVKVRDGDLSELASPHCNPRLTSSQAVELAFMVAEKIRRQRLPSRSRTPWGRLAATDSELFD